MFSSFRYFFFLLLCLISTLATARNFRLQIAAYAEPAAKDYFKQRGLPDPVQERTQGMYRYFHPQLFNTRMEAEEAEAVVKSKGFAFPVIIDLEVQRLLAETECPRVRNGLLVVKDTAEMAEVRVVYFEGKSEAMPDAAKSDLSAIITALRTHPKWTAHLAGYTDNEGHAADNMEIAANRARAVRDFIIAKGVRADRLYIEVFGESDAAAPHQDALNQDIEENRRWNRRVTVIIHDENGQPVKTKKR